MIYKEKLSQQPVEIGIFTIHFRLQLTLEDTLQSFYTKKQFRNKISRVVFMNNKVVTIKASFQKCSVDDRKLFIQSRCITPISVGQKFHEEDNFLAVIKLINSSFKECTILVDDSIQCYTMQISKPNLTLEELRKIAITDGDQWLERNQPIWRQLSIPYKIVRWDDWHQHASYKTSCDAVENLYQVDESYHQIIHDTINEFLKRHTAYMNIKEYNREQAFNNCLHYLKEECSVMCLWALEKYDFEVYPSGRNNAMKATYEKLVKPFNANILKSVGIRFKTLRPTSNSLVIT